MVAKQWFEISNEGWKRMNAGRPPYELVKELVQNILDENFHQASINMRMRGEDFILEVEDDIEGGIGDSGLITTVFMTGKEESHLKRGRKGRGLKEFLSVCEEAVVETKGQTIHFLSNGSRKEDVNSRLSGTKIFCRIKQEGWNKKAIRDTSSYLKKIILPHHVSFKVNGKEIQKRYETRSFGGCRLPTHVISNGVQNEVIRETSINLYEKAEKKGWVYEMGIPVQKTDIPYDIDVCQRIPMNDNRNEVNSDYLSLIKSSMIRAMIDSLTKKDLIGWASEGVTWSLENDIRAKIAEKIVEGKIGYTVLKSKKKVYNDKAKQKGYKVFNTSSMPYNLVSVLEGSMTKADRAIKNIEANCKPVDVIPSEEEAIFISEHSKIIKGALGMNVEIKIVEKDKDAEGNWTQAFYSFARTDARSLSYNRLALGTRGMGKKFFNDPYSIQAIDILIHEMAHEKTNIHECREYYDACTNYGARIALFLRGQGSSTTKTKTPVIRKQGGDTVMKTLKEKLVEKEGCYLTLKDIYIAMGANSQGARAGIRGILNRNCSSMDAIFERHPDGGKYKMRNCG